MNKCFILKKFSLRRLSCSSLAILDGKSFIHHIQDMNVKFNGGVDMVKCKNCGAEVESPRKTWKMAGRPDKAGLRTELTIGLFDCQNCGKSFKVVLNKQKI